MDVNRGKQTVLLDLKQQRSKDTLIELVKNSNVVIHNMRPDAASALGLNAAQLKAINPNIVLSIVSAYQGAAPSTMENWPAYDPVLQAASGTMSRFGSIDEPELHSVASCVDAYNYHF